VSKSKAKGSRFERAIVHKLQDLGLPAARTPLSGALKEYPNDVVFELRDREVRVECKKRANGEGFKTLEKWIGSADVLVVARDRQDPWVCMTWNQFADLINPER